MMTGCLLPVKCMLLAIVYLDKLNHKQNQCFAMPWGVLYIRDKKCEDAKKKDKRLDRAINENSNYAAFRDACCCMSIYRLITSTSEKSGGFLP